MKNITAAAPRAVFPPRRQSIRLAMLDDRGHAQRRGVERGNVDCRLRTESADGADCRHHLIPPPNISCSGSPNWRELRDPGRDFAPARSRCTRVRDREDAQRRQPPAVPPGPPGHRSCSDSAGLEPPAPTMDLPPYVGRQYSAASHTADSSAGVRVTEKKAFHDP